MKKIFIIISLIFLLTGCSIDYNLDIGDKLIREELFIDDPTINKNINAFITDDVSNIYEKKEENIEYLDFLQTKDGVRYSYQYDFSNYNNATIPNSCLKKLRFYNKNDEYTLSTTGYFSCIDFYQQIDKININIKLADKYIVTSTNSDIRNNNQMTWQVNKSNYKNKHIYLQFKEIEEEKNPNILDKGQENKSKHNKIIISIGLTISFLIIYLIIRIKRYHP